MPVRTAFIGISIVHVSSILLESSRRCRLGRKAGPVLRQCGSAGQDRTGQDTWQDFSSRTVVPEVDLLDVVDGEEDVRHGVERGHHREQAEQHEPNEEGHRVREQELHVHVHTPCDGPCDVLQLDST